jgi:hypothetical protein
MRAFWRAKKNRASLLLHDQQGQGTVEYIVMLSVSVGFVMVVMKKLIAPTFAKVTAAISRNVEDRLTKADLHTFRVRR